MKGKITFKGGKGSGNFGHSGRPGKVGGSSSSNRLPSDQRVWQGEQSNFPRQLTNKQTGAIGEHLAAKALEDQYGVPFSTLNLGKNNAPIDLAGDHTAVEVKAGPASNGRTAQHWRATSSTPGKKEQALLAKMTKEEKRAHHDYKRQQVLERKYKMLDEMSKMAGQEVKPMTVAVILTPDGGRGDVFMVPGFHQRLPWSEYATDQYYVGTYDVDNPAQFKENGNVVGKITFKGGTGSGHWGHAGRPPVLGGSIPGLLMSNTFINPDFFTIGPGKKYIESIKNGNVVHGVLGVIEESGKIRNNHIRDLQGIYDEPDPESMPFKFTEEFVTANPEYANNVGKDMGGYYQQSKRVIRINPEEGFVSHTFAHELGHHVTRDGSATNKRIYSSAYFVRHNLNQLNLSNKMLNDVGLRNYSLTSPDEFMADSFKVYAWGTDKQRANYNQLLSKLSVAARVGVEGVDEVTLEWMFQ